MRRALFLLALLMTGVFLVGCSNESDVNAQKGQETAGNTDITEDTIGQPLNPDIGMLDDIPVSDGLPLP